MSKRVTIKTIASELGISHMTVSRALANHPNVLEETREKVVRHAAARGYVKSAAATTMRGDGTRIVGLVLPNLVNEFYARFADAFALACEHASLQLIIHLTNDDAGAETRALARLLEMEAFATVMVPAPGEAMADLPGLKGMKIIQFIREKAMAQPHHAILADDGPAIAEAVQKLAQNGHSSIGYIGASADMSSGRTRLEAFGKAMSVQGLRIIDRLVNTALPSFSSGRQAATCLFAEGVATALVCGGVEISNGALSAYMEIPSTARARFAFVGYGDPYFYRWIDGGLSTIAIDAVPMAQHALQILTAPDSTENIRRRLAARFIERGLPLAGEDCAEPLTDYK